MKNKTLVMFLIIALLGFGWYQMIFSSSNTKNQYNELISEGDKDYKAELYQKAYLKYKEAIKVKVDREAQDKLLDSYEKYLTIDKGDATVLAYIDEIQAAINNFPKEAKYYELIMKNYIANRNFDSAMHAYNASVDNKVSTDKINSMYEDIKYSNGVTGTSFKNYFEENAGYYLVESFENVEFLKASDGESTKKSYKYAAPINKDGLYPAFTDDLDEIKVINKDNIIVRKIKVKAKSFGSISGDILSVYDGKAYSFINLDGKKIAGGFKKVSIFQAGKAFFQNDKGLWGMIDTEGKVVIDPKFEDVKLDDKGVYTDGRVVIVKEKGQYKLMDAKVEKEVSNARFEDMDIAKGDLIAFKKGENWGFVDVEGKVKIEPSYSKAKSFSNGLAAVKRGMYWGYIDLKENLVSDFTYEDAGYYNKFGTAAVKISEGRFNLLKFNFPDTIAKEYKKIKEDENKQEKN